MGAGRSSVLIIPLSLVKGSIRSWIEVLLERGMESSMHCISFRRSCTHNGREKTGKRVQEGWETEMKRSTASSQHARSSAQVSRSSYAVIPVGSGRGHGG